MKILIAGGGTGGHLFPGIAVAEEFVLSEDKNKVLFVGTTQGLEGKILPEYEWPVKFVIAGGIKGKGIFTMTKSIIKMFFGAIQSIGIIRQFKPTAILGVGGYAAVPAVIAGKLLGIKSAIHEQNAMPGLSNRLLGKIVNKVFITYAESERFFPSEKVMITGNPVRKSISASLKKTNPEGNERKFTLFIFGGSQGAKRINDVVIEMFQSQGLIENQEIRVIHQTGHNDLDRVKKGYEDINMKAEIFPFIKDMAKAYNNADLVISRAGATTISELLVGGKPAILIPYPYATDDHQRLNSEGLIKNGAARMIVEKDLTPEKLATEIKTLNDDRNKLASMSKKMKKLSRPDAAAIICKEMKEMIR